MKKQMLIVGIITLFICVELSGCLKPDINIQNLEIKIHNLINNERQSRGLSTLEYDYALAKIAGDHSEDMVIRNFFSHNNPDGLGPTDRAKMAGYNTYKDFGTYYMDGIGENICQDNLLDTGYNICFVPLNDWKNENELAISVVNSWITSPRHYQNIINPDCDREGIGIAISSNDNVYVTQDFW